MGKGRGCCNLADPGRGGAVLWLSDEFFAPAKRMLSPEEPQFDPDRYDENGKWMDGWESRRKRFAGNDACVVRICPGVIYGIEIDTRHFTGNYAPAASLEACRAAPEPDLSADWTELLPVTPLDGDSRHWFPVFSRDVWTHLRLNIYPDGGVARLRVYGRPEGPEDTVDSPQGRLNLACESLGAKALWCNDMHFGHMNNILQQQPPGGMHDGWETRRRRTPGNDWLVLRLGQPGTVRRVEVDTSFFKGNAPSRCSLRGVMLDRDPEGPEDSEHWPVLLPASALGPDQVHQLVRELREIGPISHVRFDIYPDGGVARLRLFGDPLEPSE